MFSSLQLPNMLTFSQVCYFGSMMGNMACVYCYFADYQRCPGDSTVVLLRKCKQFIGQPLFLFLRASVQIDHHLLLSFHTRSGHGALKLVIKWLQRDRSVSIFAYQSHS